MQSSNDLVSKVFNWKLSLSNKETKKLGEDVKINENPKPERTKNQEKHEQATHLERRRQRKWQRIRNIRQRNLEQVGRGF